MGTRSSFNSILQDGLGAGCRPFRNLEGIWRKNAASHHKDGDVHDPRQQEDSITIEPALLEQILFMEQDLPEYCHFERNVVTSEGAESCGSDGQNYDRVSHLNLVIRRCSHYAKA